MIHFYPQLNTIAHILDLFLELLRVDYLTESQTKPHYTLSFYTTLELFLGIIRIDYLTESQK